MQACALYNYQIRERMEDKAVIDLQKNQLFEQAKESLHQLQRQISDAETSKPNQKLNLQLELVQKLSHNLHDIKQYCHDLAILQVNSAHEAKQAKQELRKSRNKLQHAQNMYDRLSQNYQSACAQVIDKDTQINQLKQLNKIDISFIPSIDLELSYHPQKQQKNSTIGIFSSDYDPQDVLQDCDEISHRMHQKKGKQSSKESQESKQKLLKQQKQQALMSKSLDIYNLLIEIEAMGIESASNVSLSQL